MKQRKWLWLVASMLGTFAIGCLFYNHLSSVGQADTTTQIGKGAKGADPLPIRQIVLFNSGVGYFQREGEIDGDARVDLTFPIGDINDLLKSLVLQDAKGQIGAVTYESSDPIDKILRSFALDLTMNPTFGQILNQARGEKIDITRRADKKDATNKISGTIIGMEARHRMSGMEGGSEQETLNLSTTTGMQAIPMEQVISVRFQNTVLEGEFQRALQVLARSHDTQKKTVSVSFNGEGKRAVRVGYVVERPIWKTSYRLRIDKDGKLFLQGWALVENTSDDDWNDVRMVLVAGKPISFKMNLYDPIYVPRPIVEPAMFASLRPPLYNGNMSAEEMKKLADAGVTDLNGQPRIPHWNVGGQMMGMGGQMTGMGGQMMGMGGLQGMQMGGLMQGNGGGLNQFQQQSLNALARDMQDRAMREQNKLTYEELQRRREEQVTKIEEAGKKGPAVAGFNFKEGIQSVATGDKVGDYYQYSIDKKISLARQKSAMLPILDQTIEGSKVSIFNESIHARHPLLGLKLKNTSGQPLTQGPITVYDGGVFGGDTRILDVQPNESRLLSYALDQGTEVKTVTKQAPSPDMTFRIGTESLSARYHVRQTKTYTIKNRSTHDRQVILEHPIRPEWKLAEPKKVAEQTRDRYRFLVPVASGAMIAYDVIEDMPRVEDFASQPSYAIANGIHIKVEVGADQHKVTNLKIAHGAVISSHKQRQSKTYFVQNLSDMDRTFTVDYIVRPGWARLDDKNDPHAGPEVFRFKLEVAKGKTGQQSVREERDYTQGGFSIRNLSEADLRSYLAYPVASADVKAGLSKAIDMQAKIAEAYKQIAGVEKLLSVVSTDHNRIRENLRIIPMNSEHYKSFLDKFVVQDKQIETHQQELRKLTATVQLRIREYDEFLARLDAE